LDLFFFQKFKKRITEQYPELFGDSTGSSDLSASATFSAKWGWYNSIYAAAGGDLLKFDKVTKTNIHKFLMFLAFEKEKYQLEERLIKRNK